MLGEVIMLAFTWSTLAQEAIAGWSVYHARWER
jgi:hypothetical protein